MNRASIVGLGFGLALVAAACANGSSGGPTGSAGTMGTTCFTGHTACGQQCVDAMTDPANCGGCGTACATGQVCQGGACQCPSGMLCGGACVPSDAAHCGNCTTACAAGQVCSAGACSSSCPLNVTSCPGGACVVTSGNDPLNCGGCGVTCPSGQVCNAGACGCPSGQMACASGCLDTTTNNANCGACGHVCGSTQQCTNSVCVDGSTPGTAGTGGSTGGGGAAGSAGRGGTTGSAGAAGSTSTQPTLITSAQNAYWNTTGTLTTVTTGTADVTVNDTTVAQTWNGFGGTFNEVGWNVLSLLSAADRDHAMKLLFDATNGAAFVYGRVPIGASDYALDRYTLDETANDTSMAQFSITRDKQNLIPYIQAALAIRPDIHLWASPWTPPSWMKSNAAIDGGNMKEDATTMQALALYLAKFVEEYGKVGVKIETIHPQNEPGYATRYPSCLWTAAGLTKFIGSYLGPTFTSRGVAANIYLGTMSNNDSGKDGTIVTTVNADATASGLIKGYGLQWNMLPIVSGLRSRNLNIVQSEHKCGNYPWNPSGFPAFNPNKAPNDYPYAVESWGYIRDWIKAGVNVYSAWNMVLDTAGKNLDSTTPWPQNALLTVDTTAKTLTVTPVYYVFRHVSQYVVPGAKVVGTTGGDALAFKNPDGSIVTVLYNSGTAAKTTTLAVGGAKLQFSLPASGFATVIKR